MKGFRNFLLGQGLKLFTRNKNITCKKFSTDRVLRWRLVLEEYIPNIEYIPRSKNIAADDLSQFTNVVIQKTTYNSTYTTKTMS